MRRAKRERFVIGSLLFIIILLYVVKQEMTSHLNDFDNPYYLEQQQLHDLTIQNMLLEEQLLPLESYTRIASIAASMGYVKAKQFQWGKGYNPK